MDVISENAETRSGVGSPVKEMDEIHNNSHDTYKDETRLKEKSKSTVTKSLSSLAVSTGKKPGVILLGRGNSFSLGRSEVIVLHHRHKPRPPHQDRLSAGGINKERPSAKSAGIATACANDNDSHNSESSLENKFIPLQTIEESHIGSRLNSTDSADEKEKNVPSSSPPPISNGMCVPYSCNESASMEDENDDKVVVNLDFSYKADLDLLWDKVESVMAQRKERVRMILEEYGIGEPGGGGGGEEEDDWENAEVEDRKKEEEEMWQVIEDSVQVVV